MASSSAFEAVVTHLSNQGFGVIKGPDRATYFVRGTWRGDQGLFQPTDESDGTYRFAKLLELRGPSSERRNAPCPHLGLGDDQCLGCPWMMVDYAAQLQEKQHRVQYALERVGLYDTPLQSIWPSPAIFHYRRRAQFKTDGQTIGYAGREGLRIAPIDDCLVLTPPLQKHLQTLKARLPESAWQPTPPHIWNYIDLDEDSDIEDFPLNRRRPFQQANAAQNQAMRHWVSLQLQNHDRSAPVLELFAGSGNFTEVLVNSGFTRIKALEVGADAVAALQGKNWPGVEAERMDLYSRNAARNVSDMAAGTRILLANPPRDGLRGHWRLAELLPELQTIYLISCDAGAFASDARHLSQRGFRLQIVQPLDQMPHTAHVEIVARFERSP